MKNPHKVRCAQPLLLQLCEDSWCCLRRQALVRSGSGFRSVQVCPRDGNVPDEVKEDRRAEIMELQQDIAFEKSENMKGRVLEVMIEGKVADENAYVGRTYMDSPNVDGLIFVNTGYSLMSGDFARVRVTGALDYDLIGEVEDEFTE